MPKLTKDQIDKYIIAAHGDLGAHCLSGWVSALDTVVEHALAIISTLRASGDLPHVVAEFDRAMAKWEK